MLTVQKGSLLGGPWLSYLEIFSYHDRGREAGRCASKSKRKWGGQVGASGDHIGILLK